MSKDDVDSTAELGVAPQPATAVVPIGDGWSAELSPQPRGALLRVGRGAGERTLEIHIALTADGPVVRARAAALEIESDTDLVARCERFRVEARAVRGHRVGRDGARPGTPGRGGGHPRLGSGARQ
jgi:hypothetical protein